MTLRNLTVTNFRSFEKSEIDFTPLSLIVGANASGKSNLINVFRFIKDIIADGVNNAIDLQGGISYLSNVRFPKGTPITISFVLDFSDEEWYINHISSRKYTSRYRNMKYIFSIVPNKYGTGFKIAEDRLSFTSEFFMMDYSLGTKGLKPLNIILEEEYYKKNINSGYHYRPNCSTIKNKEIIELIKSNIVSKVFLQLMNKEKKELLLNRTPFFLPSVFSDSFIRIFDFDPKELKKASSITSIKSLSENGSNLASVLHEIIRKKESKEKLTTLLRLFLPYVNDLSVESNIDRSYSYTISETFSQNAFHSLFLSDGTVSILALIIALFFEERASIIILEEPERNLHPKLLINLLSSAEDVSKEKQIIITTHNPEFLKHAKIESVRLISRNKDGNSIVTEPANNTVVKTFLENDLGLDDLFMQNLLGV